MIISTKYFLFLIFSDGLVLFGKVEVTKNTC